MKKQIKKATQTPTTKPVTTQTGKIPDSVGFSFSKNYTSCMLLILALLWATSCTNNQPAEPIQKDPVNKVVVTHVGDFSKSTNQINYFDSSAANNLVYSLANGSGGTIKFIGVYENSNLQNVLSLTIESLDTVSANGEDNKYKLGRINAKNKKIRDAFNQKTNEQVARYIVATNKPHDEPYTDLASALALAATTLSQPIYGRGYNKYLLLCSDCINDPRAKRHAKVQPIMLYHTTVLVVRPTLPESELKKLFPISHVYTFTDVNDAIAMIK